jgi:hypothetical protein
MQHRHGAGAGFALLALGNCLLVLDSALAGADRFSLGFDLVLPATFGLLTVLSLTGRMEGLNDPESGIAIRGTVYFLLVLGVITTGVGIWSLAGTGI